jgi:hypothetical protein
LGRERRRALSAHAVAPWRDTRRAIALARGKVADLADDERVSARVQ